jgi:hypothetical protein
MKALDAYRDILKELDKYESPTFTIRDFNYFFPKAISRYVDANYRRKDIFQKDDDDLGFCIKLNHPLQMNSSGVIALPNDYRHMLSNKVKVKFSKDFARYKKDAIVEFYPERMKSGQKGFRNRNAFGKPNGKRYYFELENKVYNLLFDATVVSLPAENNLFVDYIKDIPDPYLNPNKASDYNNVANNSLLPFAPQAEIRTHVYYEIINHCRELFLENIESQRSPEAARQNLIQQ